MLDAWMGPIFSAKEQELSYLTFNMKARITQDNKGSFLVIDKMAIG
jgi:hypothetical protein